jgi:hypothetical protein
MGNLLAAHTSYTSVSLHLLFPDTRRCLLVFPLGKEEIG